MLKFIEEFYYGNIDPQARSTKENKAVQKQMEDLMLNEDYLTENQISIVLLWDFVLALISHMIRLYPTKHLSKT